MSDSLIPIFITDRILEAHIIMGRLEAAGIKAFVFDDQMLSTNWLYAEALGGVRVMVLESQFKQAVALLKEPVTLEDFDAFDTCPLCQSTDVMRLKPPLLMVLLTYLLLSFPYMRETHNRKCSTCSHKWVAQS